MIVWDVVFYDGLMFLHPPVFVGEGEIRFISIDKRSCWHFLHQSLLRGNRVWFFVNRLRLAAKECSRIVRISVLLAAMKSVTQVQSLIHIEKIGCHQGGNELFRIRVGRCCNNGRTIRFIGCASTWDS